MTLCSSLYTEASQLVPGKEAVLWVFRGLKLNVTWRWLDGVLIPVPWCEHRHATLPQLLLHWVVTTVESHHVSVHIHAAFKLLFKMVMMCLDLVFVSGEQWD